MKRCEIDEENIKIWRTKYQLEDNGCVLLKAIIAFDPSNCPLKEFCREVNEELLR